MLTKEQQLQEEKRVRLFSFKITDCCLSPDYYCPIMYVYSSIITRGREVMSLGFASVSFWGRDQGIINFFPVI